LSASKRIIITVSESLLSEVDEFTVLECKNRSEIVREAIRYYLNDRRKEQLRDQMKKGYLEMAEINLKLACETAGMDEELFRRCEHKLLE